MTGTDVVVIKVSYMTEGVARIRSVGLSLLLTFTVNGFFVGLATPAAFVLVTT